jgi:hypothetical protein
MEERAPHERGSLFLLLALQFLYGLPSLQLLFEIGHWSTGTESAKSNATIASSLFSIW